MAIKVGEHVSFMLAGCRVSGRVAELEDGRLVFDGVTLHEPEPPVRALSQILRKAPAKWPDDIPQDDPARAVCEDCDHLRVLQDGRAYCIQIGSCVKPERLFAAVRARDCPIGLHT